MILIGGCSMLSAILCVPLLKSGSSLRGRAVAHRPVQFAPLHYSSPWTGAAYIDAPCSPFSLCSSLRRSLQFVACSDAVQQAHACSPPAWSECSFCSFNFCFPQFGGKDVAVQPTGRQTQNFAFRCGRLIPRFTSLYCIDKTC